MDLSVFMEWAGSLVGLLGALLLSPNCRPWRWAWPMYLVSNAAWVWYSIPAHAYGLLFQQTIFLVADIIGVWRWFLTTRVEHPLVPID